MSIKTAKSCIDANECWEEVNLTGIGEPLLHPDLFFESVSYAKSKGIWVLGVTNATLLHSNDNINRMIDCGIDELIISLDGYDDKSYERIRHGSKYSRVVANIKVLVKASDRKGLKPYIKINSCISSDRFEDYAALIDQVQMLGITSLTLTTELTDWGTGNKKDYYIQDSSLLKVENIWQQVFDYAQSKSIDLALVPMHGRYDYSAGSFCSWPFFKMHISSDLRMVPCCHVGNPDHYELGSIDVLDRDTLKEAWNSSIYENFRGLHTSGNLPSICKGCYK